YTMDGYSRFEKMTDGLSNTVFFAEGLSNCQGYKVTYEYPAYTYNYTYSAKRTWNYDPYSYIYSYKSVTSTSRPPVYDVSYTYETQPPYYSYYGPYDSRTGQYTQTFQKKPRVSECYYAMAQSLTSSGLLVGLGDGSVRLVSNSVSVATWQAAH